MELGLVLESASATDARHVIIKTRIKDQVIFERLFYISDKFIIKRKS